MEAQRRTELAVVARKALPRAQRAVTGSWIELLPAAADWTRAALRRARAASRAVLEGFITIIEQGDLDDRGWEHTRYVAHGRGHATDDEVADLLHTVRLVGVATVLAELERQAALTQQERWVLQQEASVYCDEILGQPTELDPDSYRTVLAELEGAGPDLR